MKRPRGRQPKNVDLHKLSSMAMAGCKISEMAPILGVSHDVLDKRFKREIAEAREKGKAAIRNALFDEAVNKRNMRALELLAKHFLNIKEDRSDYPNLIPLPNESISPNQPETPKFVIEFVEPEKK